MQCMLLWIDCNMLPWTEYLDEPEAMFLKKIQKEIHQMLDEKQFSEVFQLLQEIQPHLASRAQTIEIIESRLELYFLEYKLRDVRKINERVEFPWKTFLTLLKQTNDESIWKEQLLAIALKANKQSISIQEYYDFAFERIKLVKHLYADEPLKMQELTKNVYHDLLTFLYQVVENVENLAKKTYVLEQHELDSIRKDTTRFLCFDPIEQTSQFQNVIEAAKKTTLEETKEEPIHRMGGVHIYWSKLKQVLQRDYDMEWIPPSFLNDALFD